MRMYACYICVRVRVPEREREIVGRGREDGRIAQIDEAEIKRDGVIREIVELDQ